MKLGIMQPYFFPYIGYFSLIQYVDKYIFFDTPQYIHHGWVNRNRIQKQGGGVKYIVVPICKNRRGTAIKEIVIDNSKNWREAIYGSLSAYKRKAPYYEATEELVYNILEKAGESLAQLNIYGIMEICRYLDIHTEFDIYSQAGIDVSNQVRMADEWALYITKELGFDTYVNPPNGESFFDRDKYIAHNIELQFLQHRLPPYIQRTGHFEPGLSIIDVMMFCSKEEIQDMLREYEIR